jgi:hypothetical protein
MFSIRKTSIIFILILSAFSCERDSYNRNSTFIARVVGYDLNCGTCILEFPYDLSSIMNTIGTSQNNYYEAVNLNKNNYEIGQQLECTVRKTKTNELTACITLYPSLNYKSIFIEDPVVINNLILNDTVPLAFHDCLADRDNKFYICLDSIVNESRCPIGLECFWAGMATVKFKFQSYQNTPQYFYLSTAIDIENKTILPGYSIKLVGLEPFPSKDFKINQNEYKAKLLITKEI